MLKKYPWIIETGPEDDRRLGVQVRHIKSSNDGDVCNSLITRELLNVERPVYCLDIGFDEGWWSVFVADTNPKAIIHGFEPNPFTYNKVVHLLKDISQINLHNLAISDKKGTLPFICDEGQSNSRSNFSDKNIIHVNCISPDDFIRNKIIDLIKIDTEGHDLIILKSLRPYLENIQAIIFECSVYWYGKTMEECIEKTIDEINYLRQYYKYIYVLSRRGQPVLYDINDDDNIMEFILLSYRYNRQSDILVSKLPILTIPIESYLTLQNIL